ncbi:MAG TPA: hydroxysqualene dehydroxylase HpnE [Burkholderiales bacterium]|nr:hydroxysqualene dehydroxylase HpnE [Burkholderiales bacterium]
MRVAIIGGGYAGMAAALTLSEAGVPVTVYEANSQLGGRARRVEINGIALDNGLHILAGAYRETLHLVNSLHTNPASVLLRLPLDWRVHNHFRFKAARLPAPLHLAAGLISVKGASWRERIAAARFIQAMRATRFQLAHDTTVQALLSNHAQGESFVRHLWEPLCLAALNTPLARASAQVFLNVLRDGLDASADAGEMLIPRCDLSTLFPDAAAERLRARGHRVRTSCTVESLHLDGLEVVVRARGESQRHTHVIVAVSPHRAIALLADLPSLAPAVAALEAFRYQPIYSVYLQFDGAVRLSWPMLGMSGLAQWLYDREAICAQRGLLGAVISAEGAHQHMTHGELAEVIHREIVDALGPLPPLAWHQVIAEKRATLECSVGLQRPSTHTALPNVHLAGDYTAGDYPATLEGAVRSGIKAAAQITSK